MKLLTLNAHSCPDEDDAQHLHALARGILAEAPEVIALQESSQSTSAALAGAALHEGYHPAQHAIPLRADNHAARLVRLLHAAGLPCAWSWLPVKLGYGHYEEGLALIAPRGRISRVGSRCLSRTRDFSCWKRRAALAICLQGLPDWFCCVHMGRWGDPEEPFRRQWQQLSAFVREEATSPAWLLGDFNAPDCLRGEGYDLIAASRWHDTHRLANVRCGHATITGAIDGWQGSTDALRIDHIWCSRPLPIAISRTVFDGRRFPVLSDHAGVLIETAGPGR